MAEVEPATVKEIIQELRSTENIRVHEELAEVALKLPVHMAAELVPKLGEWTKHPAQWVLPGKMSDLVERLARGGQVDEALDLAGELFALSPHNVYGGRDEATLPPSYKAKARFEDILYAEYLDKCSAVLVEAAGKRALTLLSSSCVLVAQIAPAARCTNAARPLRAGTQLPSMAQVFLGAPSVPNGP